MSTTCLQNETLGSTPSHPLPDGPCINLGSGPNNPDGWVNVDGSWQVRFAGRPLLTRLAQLVTRAEIGHWPKGIQYRDIRRGLGFGENSLAAVYSSHMLEHLYRDEAQRLLQEIYRSLKPGGACRIVVPDVRAIIQWYLDHLELFQNEKQRSSSDVLMGMLHLRSAQSPRRGLLGLYRRWTDLDHHKWMYDAEGLIALFQETGFEQPKQCDYLESSIPRETLEAVEEANRICDNAGVCVEARK